MAFVDVSGFTAMSERLAPKGRLGAEEVTDVMSATFGRLLAVAYGLGGGLVKLGGDALLLFFDGDDHAARACAAAWGMRDSLAALGPLQTSVGPVELKMHVGIHSGDFDFFLVGTRHRELIVAGPDAAVTVEMEDTAEAGEIAVSDATAAQIETSCLGDRKGAGNLLAWPPAVRFTGVASLPDTSELDVAACIPEALRGHLAAGRVESEHRRAAVAFVRFGGADQVLDTDAVEEVVDALEEAAAAHGVCFLESDIDAIGGRIILVAGVPTTAGEDEERLLRTVRAAVDAQTTLPLHVGVAARQRLRRPDRTALSAGVHDPRRHGRARRAPDGESGRALDLDDAGSPRAVAHGLRHRAGRRADAEGEGRARRRGRGRRRFRHPRAGLAEQEAPARRPAARAAGARRRARTGAHGLRQLRRAHRRCRASASRGSSRSSATGRWG